MTDATEQQHWRFFYEELERRFRVRFGDHTPWAAGAWASARQRELSPVASLRSIFFYFIGRPGDRYCQEGRLIDDICRAWGWGKDGGEFRTVYVSDFLDVILGHQTRLHPGVVAGPPLPIDRWALRQAGFVDEQFEELAEEAGVEVLGTRLEDDPGPDEYEQARRFFLAKVAAYNEQSFLAATDWKAHQAESFGRFELQTRLDLEPLTADEIFEEANLDG